MNPSIPTNNKFNKIHWLEYNYPLKGSALMFFPLMLI